MTMNHQKWHPTWCVLLLSALVLATDSDDWVDPNDMEFRNTKTTKRPSDIAESKDLSMISNALKLEESPKKITNPEAKFLQRHVARLLTAFKLKRTQILDYSRTPVKAKTVVVWDATSIASLITYDKLAKNETQNHKRITMLHAVEKAFEELFKDVTFFNEDRLESESMTENIFHSMTKSILDNVWLTLPIVVTVIIGMALWRGTPLWKIFLFTFIISCGWEWSHMYKKALAKRQAEFHDSVPNHCKSSSFLNTFFGSGSGYNKECVRYHEAVNVEPFLEVTPAVAIAETFSKIILHPLEPLGRKLGIFFNGVLNENSYVASFVVLPFSLLVLMLIILAISGYSFSLPFYLGRFEPKSRNQKSDGKESLDHKKLLELLHEMKVLKQVVQELNYTKQKLEYNTENTAQVLNSKAIVFENDDVEEDFKEVFQELNSAKQKVECLENQTLVLNPKAIACKNGDAKGEYDSFELCEDIVENVTASAIPISE